MRVAELYSDPIRRASAELELGSGWLHAGESHAVYWIEATGEVFALRHPDVAFGPGTPKPFGVYLPRFAQQDEHAEVEVLGRADREEVETVRAEAEGLGDDKTLDWLRERLA